MKSVRMGADRERRLREAAARYGVSESEFIRQAVDRACDEALAAPSWYDRVQDLVGTAHLGEDTARRHHELFGEAVDAKFERIKRENEARRRAKAG